jgi:hypothetical protein
MLLYKLHVSSKTRSYNLRTHNAQRRNANISNSSRDRRHYNLATHETILQESKYPATGPYFKAQLS